MAKAKTHFVCRECGASSLKWQGQCRQCGEWNCLVEEVIPDPNLTSSSFKQSKKGKLVRLGESVSGLAKERLSTGMAELDRVLGGGLVCGSYILLGGAPGVGKSTLLLQMAEGISRHGTNPNSRTVLYVSAEESAEQMAMRAKRLSVKKEQPIFVLNETSLDQIFQQAETVKPDVLVVDSIQTVYLSDLSSAPGSVSQVRECAGQLMNFAKNQRVAVFVIGHVTKDGQLAGPRLLEHTVDVVLSFDGDANYHFRILRALKNRFGATDEIGVFQMSSQGLTGVSNPSSFFLEERGNNLIGSVVFTAMKGSRPLLCEIQALVLRSYLPQPRRTAIGMDVNRLNMIIAVLDRYLKTGLAQCDVFVNIAGGLKVTEPASDLATAGALLSARFGTNINQECCFFGEVGLTGEIRASVFCEERVKEALKLGFKHIYMPEGNRKTILSSHSKLIDQKSSLKGIKQIKDIGFIKDLQQSL